MFRISWNEENSYVFMKDGVLLHNQPYHKHQKKINGGYPYVIADDDMYANDWMMV